MVLTIIILSTISLTTTILLTIIYTEYRFIKIDRDYYLRRSLDITTILKHKMDLKVGTIFEIPHYSTTFKRYLWGVRGEILSIGNKEVEVRLYNVPWNGGFFKIDITKVHLLVVKNTPSNQLKHKFS